MSGQLNLLTIIFHIISVTLGILLICYSILLLRKLRSEDFVLSMIFLHETQIRHIALVIVVGAFVFLVGQTYYSLFPDANVFILKIAAIIYSVSLLYFVYGLKSLFSKGDENEYL